MKRNAAIVIANGYTDAEFLVSFHYLKAHGFDLSVYSLNGGPVTGIQGWVHKTSYRVVEDCLQYTGEFKDLGMLVLVGGVKAIEKLRLCKLLITAIKARHNKGGIIATICHGSQLCIEADLVRGRQVLGYYSIRRDLENAGAIWPEGFETFVEDTIVSATHYDYSGDWIKRAVELWEFKYREYLHAKDLASGR